MSSPTLRVLVVSENRKLLRQTSRFLNMFGYCVQQVAGTERARTALAGERPHVLILDASDGDEAIHWLGRQGVKAEDGSSHLYTLLLTGQANRRTLADAMAAGVDDFLHAPMVFGELLTRLRAAARTIERERRIGQQEGIDLLTGLPNREACCHELRSRTHAAANSACVVADLDLLAGVNRVHGRTTGDQLIRAAVEKHAALGGPEFRLAGLGGGRFAVLLADTSLAGAKAWAERGRCELAALEIGCGDEMIRFTASFGVATGPGDQLLTQAEAAMQAAKHSGRDCVVAHGQFDEEATAWAELAAPGKLFEQTAARHVMLPLTITLPTDASSTRAATLLEATRLDAIVVVDAEGRLAGLVSSESDLADPGRPLAEVMDAAPSVFEEDTPLATLLESFMQDAPSRAVITDRGKPTGIVSREQLATLSEAVTVDRFAPGKPCSSTSEYLVVLDRALAGNTW